jgi:hypothetical protein
MMQLRGGKIVEALKVLNSVTPEYPSYANIQYLIADTSLKADTEKTAEPFMDAARGEKAPVPFRERGLAALRSITEPTNPDQLPLFYQAKSRLGLELYRDKKFAEMEALATPLLQKVATTKFHADNKRDTELRDHFHTQLMKVRLFAKVGQADLDMKANDFKKVADLVDPIVKDLKAGTGQPKTDPLVVQTYQSLLTMALRANVHLGDLERVKQIVEVYGKAVGEDPATVAVPEVLRRMVPIIRVQVKELKAKNDFAGKDKVVAAFTTIVDDLRSKQKKQPPPVEFLLVLAECYGSMDQTDKAIDVLEKIPVPPAGDMDAIRAYQASRLAYLRQLRLAAANDPKKKDELVKKASKLLNEWMGTKEMPGWASKVIDAHKERLYLYEMEDETGAGFNKAQALVKSMSAKGINPADQAAIGHYVECYYYMVYFLYANGKKQTAASLQAQRTAEAASRIVALEEQYKDFGNDEMKKKFNDLLNAEPKLKIEYMKAKKK